jgi:hypothetical protein
MTFPKTPCQLCQLLEERPGLLQVLRVKSLGEPGIDLCQQLARFGSLTTPPVGSASGGLVGSGRRETLPALYHYLRRELRFRCHVVPCGQDGSDGLRGRLA